MSTSPEPQKKEHPSTYFVQDRSNQEELMRVMLQSQMVTTGMGGVLTEQPDPARFHSVLDVGCGTGDWLIEAARTYPTMTRLVGVDVSSKMVEYARTKAEEQQVSDRIQFQVMDALRMLEYPSASFDLVNLRLGASFLRTWDWLNILHEFARVIRSKGVIRLTEGNIVVESSSPALTLLLELAMHAFHQAGHFFAPQSDGVTKELVRLLRQSGIKNVQSHTYVLEYVAGTPESQLFFEDMQKTFRTALPFFKKWLRVPDDYQETYQQALREMQQPDFLARWTLLTVWGNA
jgi:ubiquinone/menaquinone biosynthesis C-methylase UbiE